MGISPAGILLYHERKESTRLISIKIVEIKQNRRFCACAAGVLLVEWTQKMAKGCKNDETGDPTESVFPA
jgi:hypothetical protein